MFEIKKTLSFQCQSQKKIPHFIKSYHDLAYDGLFQFQKGWGQVEAPPEFRDQIVDIYNDLNQGE